MHGTLWAKHLEWKKHTDLARVFVLVLVLPNRFLMQVSSAVPQKLTHVKTLYCRMLGEHVKIVAQMKMVWLQTNYTESSYLWTTRKQSRSA